MKNVAIIFGSRSVEHDISIITANQIINNIDKLKYNIVPIYIDEASCFYFGNELLNICNFKNKEKLISKLNKIYFDFQNKSIFYFSKLKIKKSINIDFCILSLHGLHGEDGAAAGLMELLGVPYSSAGILSSAICMDKSATKTILKQNEISVIDYVIFEKNNEINEKNIDFSQIYEKLQFPLIVKPCSLGSSIGINKANNKDELIEAISVAFAYDNKIIIENALTDFVELNIGVFKKENEILLSEIEQPISWQNFLSFEDKYISKTYISGNKVKKENEIDLNAEILSEVRAVAKNSYKILDLNGFVRCDFLFDRKNNVLYLNEINTIPGSLSFYLWKNHFPDFKSQIDEMIKQGIWQFNIKNNLTYTYQSKALVNFDNAIKFKIKK